MTNPYQAPASHVEDAAAEAPFSWRTALLGAAVTISVSTVSMTILTSAWVWILVSSGHRRSKPG